MDFNKLEVARYHRDYSTIKQLTSSTATTSTLSPTEKEYIEFLAFESECLDGKTSFEVADINNFFIAIDAYIARINPNSLVIIDIIGLKLQLGQQVPSFSQDIRSTLHNLPNISRINTAHTLDDLRELPFRAKSYLEIYLKKILNPDLSLPSAEYLKQLEIWMEIFETIEDMHPQSRLQQFKGGLEKVSKNLIMICINKYIQTLNKMTEKSHMDIISAMLQLFTKSYRYVYGIDLVITLLYNILKNILAINQFSSSPSRASPASQLDAFRRVTHPALQEGVLAYFNAVTLIVDSWEQLLYACLSFVQRQIEKKVEKYMKTKPKSKHNPEQFKLLEESNPAGINFRDIINIPTIYYDSLYLYTCVNFTQVRNATKIIMKTVLSYRMPSLINILSLRLKREDFVFSFMEYMMSTPFDDNILGMKMSVQLYLREEYSKLYQLIQSLTQSEQLPSHSMFPMLVSLASVFTGLNLGKNEEGLALAKLNLTKHQAPQRVILPETLLAHVGFSYYNIYRNSTYEQDKTVYLSKAVEYFEASYAKNPKNYLVCQALAKSYAQTLQLDKALQFAQESCTLNKTSQHAFILLALIYSAKGELKKCQLLINSLLPENKHEPILFVLLAFIETEKFLHSRNSHPDYKVAPNFGNAIYSSIKLESQKSKQYKDIILYLVKACQSILGKESLATDLDRDFSKDKEFVVPLRELHSQEIMPRVYLDYKNTLSYFIDILFHIEHYESIDNMASLLNDGNKKNIIESEYYKALLAEKEGEFENAIAKYEEILKQDFYHQKSMQNLALLLLQHQNADSRRLDRAVELLLASSKFQESPEILYGFGELHKIQGNLPKSNHYFLKALEKTSKQPVCSYDLIPDLLFYL